jgi:hypothetical protein
MPRHSAAGAGWSRRTTEHRDEYTCKSATFSLRAGSARDPRKPAVVRAQLGNKRWRFAACFLASDGTPTRDLRRDRSLRGSQGEQRSARHHSVHADFWACAGVIRIAGRAFAACLLPEPTPIVAGPILEPGRWRVGSARFSAVCGAAYARAPRHRCHRGRSGWIGDER